MNGSTLHELSTDALVEYFVEISLAQYRAEERDDNAEYNRLFGRMVAVREELKSRSGDQRRKLMSLYGHQNMQVRLNAANATLFLAPDAARHELEAISASKWMPQSLDAGMALWNLDRGVYKPE